jgi:hypothetical protein
MKNDTHALNGAIGQVPLGGWAVGACGAREVVRVTFCIFHLSLQVF